MWNSMLLDETISANPESLSRHTLYGYLLHERLVRIKYARWHF